MEEIFLFYDNALIYSPNVFFFSLGLLLSLTTILTFKIFIAFVHSLNRKGAKKRTKSTLKITFNIVSVMYNKFGKKRARVNRYVRKTVNLLKEEVLIKRVKS